MAPVRGGAGGHGRDRPGGAGHHASPGGDLHARVVHVEHLRPLPLPVRHHRGGGGAGQPAGLVHADADDERPAAARGGRCRGGGHGGASPPRSRRGFYALHRRAPTRGCSRWAMRHRRLVAIGAVARRRSRPCRSTAWSGRSTCPPTWTRPSSTSTSTRPEGTSLAAMDEAMRAIEAELRAMPRRAADAHHRRRRLPRRRQPGQRLRAHRAARGAHLLARPALARDPAPAIRWRPSAATTRQRDVMQEIRRRLRKFRDLRITRAQRPSFNIGGGNFDIDFVLRGPDLDALAEYAEQPAGRAPTSSAASSTPTPPSSSTSPSCAWRSTASGPPTSASTARTSRTALRLMVGGDQEVSRFRDPAINEDYDVQLRLVRGRPQRSRHHLAALRAALRRRRRRPGGSPTWSARQSGDARARPDRLAHRPPRPPAAGAACAPGVAPGYALGRPPGGAARRRPPR